MTTQPIPPRWAFERVEQLKAEWWNAQPNDLNVDVVMADATGWAHYHMFAAYIASVETAPTTTIYGKADMMHRRLSAMWTAAIRLRHHVEGKVGRQGYIFNALQHITDGLQDAQKNLSYVYGQLIQYHPEAASEALEAMFDAMNGKDLER